MLLHFSFTVLLASLLLLVEARPTAYRRQPGVISMPLQRIKARTDVHPQILLQQHINRSQKRLARMTGRAEPSEHEFRRSMEKRMFLLPSGPVPSLKDLEVAEKRFNHAGTHRVSKRFNHAGTGRKNGKRGSAHVHGESNEEVAAAVAKATVTVTVTAEVAAETGVAPVANAPAVAAPKGVNATTPAVPKAATAGAAAGATANPGVTQIEIDALTNGGSTPASAPTADNSLGLEIFANDVGYFATVQIGTPPRDFKMLMDSGSADFWVGAENCKSEVGGDCGNHTFLGPKASSTFKDTGANFQVTYGTGAVQGSKIQDDVSIAGLKLKTLDFGVAEVESVEFSGDGVEFDGLIGTAQSILANQKVLTPVEKLKADGLITSAITSYKMGRLADGAANNDGEITFGGLDPTKFDAASLVTVPNLSAVGFWEAAMDKITVNGVDLKLAGRKAILDTGTTLILAPAADATALHAGIEGAKSDGQGGFIVPCTTTASIKLTFGGSEFSIDPRDLAFAPVDINNPTGDCISGISAGNIGDATEWLVGDTFLKSVYFSHDVDKNEMSLANLK